MKRHLVIFCIFALFIIPISMLSQEAISPEEKNARSRLKSIIGWSKYYLKNPSRNLRKLRGYLEKAQPHAEVLLENEERHQDLLAKYKVLFNAVIKEDIRIAKGQMKSILRNARRYLGDPHKTGNKAKLNQYLQQAQAYVKLLELDKEKNKDILAQYQNLHDAVNQKPVDKKPVDKKPVDKKPVDKKPVDKKPVDKKPVDKKPVDKKPVDKKPVDNITDTTPVETTVDKKPVENKPKPLSREEKNAMSRLKSTLNWAKPYLNPNRSRRATHLRSYVNKAKSYVEVLAKNKERHKGLLDQYEALVKATEEAESAEKSVTVTPPQPENQTTEPEPEEIAARKKLKSIFSFAKSYLTNPRARNRAQKLRGFANKAKKYADVLMDYKERNSDLLSRYENLLKEAENAENFEFNQRLAKDLRSLNQFKQLPALLKSGRISDQQAKMIIPMMVKKVEQEFAKVEAKYPNNPTVAQVKKDFEKTKEELEAIYLGAGEKILARKLLTQAQKTSKKFANEKNGYNERTFDPNSTYGIGNGKLFKEYEETIAFIKKHQHQIKTYRKEIDSVLAQLVAEQKESYQFLVNASCKASIRTLRTGGNHDTAKNYLEKAIRVAGANAELAQVCNKYKDIKERWLKAEAEIRVLKQELKKRVKQASAEAMASGFDSYKKQYSHVGPNREKLLVDLESNKGKAITSTTFEFLRWSEGDWHMDHNGKFRYAWGKETWETFRKMELEQFKIFRDHREKILQRHNTSDLGASGHTDWSFPGFHDITLIALVDGTSPFTPKLKVRNKEGKVVGFIDGKTISLVRVKIIGFKSLYFTYWPTGANSNEKLNLQGLID